jgi:hypothetical protein
MGSNARDCSELSLRAPATETESESSGFAVFREGLPLLERVVSDQRNLVVGPQAFYLDSYGYSGFTLDLTSNYRTLSVVRTRPAAALFVSRRARGSYYPAFILYDAQGEPDQVVTLFVGNERRGVAVVKEHDNRSYLFVLSRPCHFAGTALITIMTPDVPGGSYRIENLLLLADMPPQQSRPFTFDDVSAVPLGANGSGARARITWTTSWATRSRLQYGPSPVYGQWVEGDDRQIPRAADTYAKVYRPPTSSIYNNHRLLLTGLEERQTYHFRLVGSTPEGAEISSQDYTFTAVPRPAPKGDAERATVALQVDNAARVARNSWPVTTGLPMPRGALGSAEHTRLVDAAGNQVALQTATLARWPDGSVKWLLTDFQADVAAASSTDFRLHLGRRIRRDAHLPERPISITRRGAGVELDTGPLKLRFDPREACFPARVWLDDEELTDPRSPGAIELVDGAGTLYTSADGPCAVEVEESGPLRAVVKVSGEHQAPDGRRLFGYVTRVGVFAGKTLVRVLHTWENNCTAAEFTVVRSLMVRVPLRLRGPTCTLMGDGAAVYQGAGGPNLTQSVDDAYTVVEGDTTRHRGRRAAGLVDLSDGTRGLGVTVRHFWQNYPKSVGAMGSAVVVGLCPPLDRELYADECELEDKLFYYLRDGVYQIKQGMAKTQELAFHFHHGDFQAARSDTALGHSQQPLTAIAPPQWYCDSKAFGDVAVADENAFPRYERFIGGGVERYLHTREAGREYGMLNFGDWYHVQKWGNIEYDTPHVLFLQFVRSGDRRCLTLGEESARHYMDVDTCHHHRDGALVDRVYAHCIGHVGGYYPYYYRKGGAQGVIELEVDHTWVQGLLDYHFLSGDRRSLETARKIADKYDSLYTVNFDFASCRRPGWHLILTMAMFQATGDDFYLNAARLIFRRVAERQTAHGWPHQLPLGHCECLPRHRGNADFMVAVLLSGLIRLHQATGDEQVADCIVAGAAYLIDEHWVEERRAFRYTQCPKSGISGSRNSLILEGPAYAYRLTGREAFRRAVLAGFDEGISGTAYATEPIGKTLGERAGVAPHILYEIDRWERA